MSAVAYYLFLMFLKGRIDLIERIGLYDLLGHHEQDVILFLDVVPQEDE